MEQRDIEKARIRANEYFEKAGIFLTELEKANIEIADMGLNMLDTLGLQLHTYISTKRCSAKELVLFPGQICPEHRHPPIEGGPGKEETFRVRWGEMTLYVPGPPANKASMKAKIPEEKADTFTVFHEIELKRGDQYTLEPNTLHWFCAGPEGCVVSEFSTYNRDDMDIFTDPDIVR
jgi:D-lyxose ketol-isomerase